MKKILAILLLTGIIQHAVTQVTGKVVNTAGQPAPLANVKLVNTADTGITKTGITTAEGVFSFSNIAAGTYSLRISSVGYQPIQVPAFTVNGPVNLGLQVMLQDVQQLGSVTVKAQRQLYKQTPEGVVVNAEASLISKGSSALELLERSPGVLVDRHNNNIALNGKQGVMVMINGKLMRMSTEQLISLLNSMSADDIASIELLNTPPAKYDAEGSAGVINIVLKADKAKGTSGSATLTAGYGYREKGSANLRISRNTAKTDWYAAYSFYHDRRYGHLHGEGYEVVPALGGAATFLYNGVGHPGDNSHYIRAGVDERVSSSLTIGGSVNYSISASNNISHNTDLYNILPDSLLYFDGAITGKGRWNNLVTSLYAEKKLGEGSKLNVDVDYLRYTSNTHTAVKSSFTDKNGQSAGINGDTLFAPLQKSFGETLIQVGVARLDYTRQLNKKIKIESGLKGTYTKSDASSGITSLVNGQWVNTVETANDMIMKEAIGAAYASVNIQVNKSTSVTAGSRYEYYYTRANDAASGKQAIKRNFGQLFPSLFVSKQLGSSLSQLQFSYTKRITRPSYNDLASYVAYNDPLSVFTGNPLLKPTITDNIKIGYSYSNYIFSLIYSHDKNAIVQGQVTSSPSGYIAYIAPQNISWQNSVLAQTIIPVKPAAWWNTNYTITGGWHNYKMDYTPKVALVHYWGYSLNFSQQFTLPKKYTAEISGVYNSASYYANGKAEPNGTVNLGFKKELNNNKGAFQLSVTDVLQTGVYRNYIGFVPLAFETQARIKWYNESTKFPIIKLTYTRSFGGSQKKIRDNNLDDEANRVK